MPSGGCRSRYGVQRLQGPTDAARVEGCRGARTSHPQVTWMLSGRLTGAVGEAREDGERRAPHQQDVLSHAARRLG